METGKKTNNLHVLPAILLILTACIAKLPTLPTQPAPLPTHTQTPYLHLPTEVLITPEAIHTYAPTVGTVKAARLKVRECANTSASCPEFAYLHEGDTIEVCWQSWSKDPECQHWFMILYDGRPGWVCANWIEIN